MLHPPLENVRDKLLEAIAAFASSRHERLQSKLQLESRMSLTTERDDLNKLCDLLSAQVDMTRDPRHHLLTEHASSTLFAYRHRVTRSTELVSS